MAYTYRFELRSSDGDDIGTFETSENRWRVGDVIRAGGNVPYRITAIVPLERIGELGDEPTPAVWEVEALEGPGWERGLQDEDVASAQDGFYDPPAPE